MYEFEWEGGVRTHFSPGIGGIPKSTTDKFLLFFLSGKKEITLSMAMKDGLVSPKLEGRRRVGGAYVSPMYDTSCPVVKVFVYRVQQGHPPFFYSFYVLMGATDKQLTIQPLSNEMKEAGWLFKAEGRFLRTTELAKVLDSDSKSYQIALKQSLPSKDVLSKIITVRNLALLPEEPVVGSIRQGVRLIRREDKDLIKP